MKIRNTDFIIDADKLESKSTNMHKILFPYHGPLPVSYNEASLYVEVSMWRVALVMTAIQDRKKTDYLIEASPEEITGIMMPFFYTEMEPRTFKTRYDNGLSNYWTGFYQADYISWEQYITNPLRIAEIVDLLPQEQRSRLCRYLWTREGERMAEQNG